MAATTEYKPHPLRIQLRRVKGWRKPQGAVVVSRPTAWGNPFWWEAKFYGLELSLALYRDAVRGVWNPATVDGFPDVVARNAYDAAQEWKRRFHGHPSEALPDLRGRQLCCWCPTDRPCHADILCELANQE